MACYEVFWILLLVVVGDDWKRQIWRFFNNSASARYWTHWPRKPVPVLCCFWDLHLPFLTTSSYLLEIPEPSASCSPSLQKLCAHTYVHMLHLPLSFRQIDVGNKECHEAKGIFSVFNSRPAVVKPSERNCKGSELSSPFCHFLFQLKPSKLISVVE